MFKKVTLACLLLIALVCNWSCTKEKTITGPTVYNTDTLIIRDTVSTVDTLVDVDTLVVHDTTVITQTVTIYDTTVITTVSTGAAFVALQEIYVDDNPGNILEFTALGALATAATEFGLDPNDFGYAVVSQDTWLFSVIVYSWADEGYFQIVETIKYLGGNPDNSNSWQLATSAATRTNKTPIGKTR